MKPALGAASVQLPLAIDDRSSLLREGEREGTQSEWGRLLIINVEMID